MQAQLPGRSTRPHARRRIGAQQRAEKHAKTPGTIVPMSNSDHFAFQIIWALTSICPTRAQLLFGHTAQNVEILEPAPDTFAASCP